MIESRARATKGRQAPSRLAPEVLGGSEGEGVSADAPLD